MTRAALPVFLLLAALLSCGPPPPRCFTGSDCPFDGQLWTCSDEQQCVAQTCETNLDCPITWRCALFVGEEEDPQQVLSEERAKTCQAGCSRDNDCLANQFCDEGQCAERPCRTGHLDCNFCEICDASTHTCKPAGAPFCQTCNDLNTLVDQGDPNNPCDQRAIGNSDCGMGNACWPYFGQKRCAVACDSNSDCPGGFVCTDLLMSAPACNYGITSLGTFCLGECETSRDCATGQ